MTVSAITDHINDHIFFKSSPVVSCKPNDVRNGFRVLAVHMKDRYHQHFSDISRVPCGTCFFGKSGISDLIIDHDMNGSAATVAIQLRHVERFRHNPLPGKGRITVNQYRQYLISLICSQQILTGADKPFHNRIDGFQMAGVIEHVDSYQPFVLGFEVRQVSLVVLHIS